MDSIINGLVAGYIGAFIVYPLDFLKNCIQNNIKLVNIKLKYIYRGLFINLIGIGPEKTIKLFVNNNLISNKINPILAGACAGACQALVSIQFDYIKFQYQKNYKIIKLKLRFECCLAKDIIFSAIYFPVYSYLKLKLDKYKYANFISGYIAALPAAYLTMPFEIIKERIGINSLEYKNIWRTIRIIYKKEGIRFFWKGVYWRMIKTSPQFATTISIYEILNKKN